MFASVGRLFGLPFYNIKRDAVGIVNTALGFIGNWELMYRFDKLLYSIDSSDNRSHYYDIAFYAWREDDKTQYNAIVADMLKHGYTQKDIESAIRTRLKKTENFSSSADAVRSSIEEDLEKRGASKAFRRNTRQKRSKRPGTTPEAATMLEQNADYELRTPISWIEKADGGADVGLERGSISWSGRPCKWRTTTVRSSRRRSSTRSMT
jgi:Arc/MetJ-type ribon-helix-helix transcriptional regulator